MEWNYKKYTMYKVYDNIVDAVRKLDSTVSYEKTGVCTVYGMVT